MLTVSTWKVSDKMIKEKSYKNYVKSSFNQITNELNLSDCKLPMVVQAENQINNWHQTAVSIEMWRCYS